MSPRRASLPVRLLWALPCSPIGALLGLVVVSLGGSARRVDHTVEVGLFGRVVVGQSHEALAVLRAHERVHVMQYELLGPLFFIAYPASSLLALLRGRCPCRGNGFERQAFAETSCRHDAGRP